MAQFRGLVVPNSVPRLLPGILHFSALLLLQQRGLFFIFCTTYLLTYCILGWWESLVENFDCALHSLRFCINDLFRNLVLHVTKSLKCWCFLAAKMGRASRISDRFLLLARYVLNVPKRSIWDQYKKKYILRTDRRPTNDWPATSHMGKFQMAISPRGVVRFTSCLVLRWCFRGRRIEWRYFRFR